MKKLDTKNTQYCGRFDLGELAYLRPETKPLTCISLFSGCGGFDIGTALAGFQTRVMVEWEKAACDTLRSNFTMAGHREYCDRMIALLEQNTEKKLKKKGLFIKLANEWAGPDDPKARAKMIDEHKRWRNKKPGNWYHKPEPVIMCADITRLSTKKILEAGKLRMGECTLLTGGFPCQGFSTARGGTRDTTNHKYDKRNLLYKECVRVIREALPKTFALENVPGLISMEKGAVVKMICRDLAEVGYDVSWDKLNAADYGVPQNRIRVFFFGKRNDVMTFDAKGKRPPVLHIAGSKGTIKHPDWFIKKYDNKE